MILLGIIEEALLNDVDGKLSGSGGVVLHYGRAIRMFTFPFRAVDISMDGLEHVKIVLGGLEL
jgi:hypothetical protein